MDAALASSINRRDARLIAEHLDALDTRLSSDRKPWYLGPMGRAFIEDENCASANSYRAWLIGKHAWRIPDLYFDGAPADADWDDLFAHLRAEILARRAPQTPHAKVAETRLGVVV